MREIDFQDGFTSVSAPDQGDVEATKVRCFATDAAFLASKDDPTPECGDLYFNETENFLRVYGDDAAWHSVGAASGYQEIPAGITNGVNTTFGPLTFVPVNEQSVFVTIDGIKKRLTTDWSLTGSNIVFTGTSIPAAGQTVEVYYLFLSDGNNINIGGGLSVTPRTEYRVLIAGDITAKQITLAQSPTSPSEVMLDLVGGTSQVPSVDFSVTGSTLSWNGLALDGVLTAGDILRVFYWY